MQIISTRPALGLVLGALALSAAGTASAQQTPQDSNIVVTGAPVYDAAAMTEGPEVKGVISARNGDRIKVTTADGRGVIVAVNDATRIRAGSGIFGSRSKLATDSLLNGLPVTVKTLQYADGQPGGDLLASQISFRKNDLKTASMIRAGTAQGFEEQTAATEGLRGRLGDIDKYNIKGTTNVHFDTGKADISAEAKAELCSAAASAEGMDNALLLVVGYTDSTGNEDINQELSDKRAGRVMNFLQQKCGWKPYRMLTPTGMATSDPLASNDTPEGKAQNRRVAVNVLVSKSVDGL
ncbi:MAG: OmpA family protein [Sphingomonadales bacterium]|nr:MAG: OmpA family protein [Sphingomonadales bacterium]